VLVYDSVTVWSPIVPRSSIGFEETTGIIVLAFDSVLGTFCALLAGAGVMRGGIVTARRLGGVAPVSIVRGRDVISASLAIILVEVCLVSDPISGRTFTA
jgi:hypothetical protein